MRTRKNHYPLPIRSGKKKKQAGTEGRIRGEDLISDLPDDILVRILSLLTTQESVRCSILSHRWAPLPKLVPVKLNFVKKYLTFYNKFEELRKVDGPEFVRRVDRVVDSFRGETIDEFCICFALDIQNECQIDKWIQFAMEKKVKKFELDLFGSYRLDLDQIYWFPSIFYYRKLRSRHIGLPSCTSLTALRLCGMYVTGEHIEHFLECCPFLESVCVTRCHALLSLKVDDPVQLKLLEVECRDLQVIEISAPNLMSFKYSTDVTTSMQVRAPQLTEMLVNNGSYRFLVNNFHLFKCCLSQIEILSLFVNCSRVSRQEIKWPMEIPTLSNLKQLTIYVRSFYDKSAICLTSWIEASPLLRRFVLQSAGTCGLEASIKPREALEPITGMHQHLKEFEFIGFKGKEADTRLVLYVIENTVNLEKFVIDCRDPSYIDTYYEDKGTSRMMLVRKESAKKLQSRISPTVEFVLKP